MSEPRDPATTEPAPPSAAELDLPTDASLLEIIAAIELALAAAPAPTELRLRVPDPDLGRGRYAGERLDSKLDPEGRAWIHRPLQLWVELAARLGLRLMTPNRISSRVSGRPDLVELRFETLDPEASWHRARPQPQSGDIAGDTPDRARRERYGQHSEFSRISKLEDPGFVIDVAEALERIGLARLPAPRILALGVNRGDELELLCALTPGLAEGASFVGIDHSGSAIEQARARFPDPRHNFITADLDRLDQLPPHQRRALEPQFDLAVSMSTLHSPGVDADALLRALVKTYLRPSGALLLGVPNCRYIDGERVHGARIRNLREPELGLVVKTLAFYRRYLQQHRRRVYITGKHYLLVTAVAQ